VNTAQKTLKTAQLSNIVREPLKRALNASQYEVKAIPNLIRFLHAAAGYPVIKTWLKAIEKHFINDIMVWGSAFNKTFTYNTVDMKGQQHFTMFILFCVC
jgi:hypothetical protein